MKFFSPFFLFLYFSWKKIIEPQNSTQKYFFFHIHHSLIFFLVNKQIKQKPIDISSKNITLCSVLYHYIFNVEGCTIYHNNKDYGK